MLNWPKCFRGFPFRPVAVMQSQVQPGKVLKYVLYFCLKSRHFEDIKYDTERYVWGINWGIIWGMSGVLSGACLGHHLGHVWGIFLDMSGTTSGAYC